MASKLLVFVVSTGQPIAGQAKRSLTGLRSERLPAGNQETSAVPSTRA